MNLTEVFTNTLYTQATRPLPDDVALEARKCLMDEVGCMLAGSELLKERLTAYLDCFSGDDATVVGLGRRASLQNAALVNGLSGHAYDFDDGHRFSTAHLGSTVIPAVLAAAEKENLSMDAVLRGLAIGYETGVRLGRCIQPSHRSRGFHASGTIGTIGAAMGVAAALGFDRETFDATFAAACTSAAGIIEMQQDTSTLKPYNIGRAAHDGVTAAYVAKAGFRGPNDTLNGPFGFLKCACEVHKDESLELEENAGFLIAGSYHKPYASCRHTHSPVYSVVKAVEEGHADWHDITGITIRMYGQGVKGHDHTDIPSMVAGKMSIPFCVALALKTGKIGIDSFNEDALKDQELLDLTKLVRVEADEEMTSWVPNRRAASAEVTLRSGEVLHGHIDYAPGEPELPLSMEELRQKTENLAVAAGFSVEKVQRIADVILSENGTAAELMAALA